MTGRDPATADRVRALHESALLIDGHNDLPWRIRERGGLDAVPLGSRVEDGHTDLPRLRAGGVDAQFWAAWVPPRFRGPDAVRVAREQIAVIDELESRFPDLLERARTASDIERIAAAGRIASLIGVEGGHAIDGSLDVLRELYERGARYLTLTHTASLDWVDAAGDEPRAGGLSAFGRRVIGEMNRLGMIVDLSHVSDRAMHDALDASAAPVLFSHSSARALADHPRNVPDDVLARLPANGGVVMVNFFSGFLTPAGTGRVPALFREEERMRAAHPDPAGFRDARDRWYRGLLEVRGTVAVIADHIGHVAERAGIEHVGLGSDFDGVPMTPLGMEDVSCFPALTAELVSRGFSDGEVRAVLGGNALRALKAVERAAAGA
ncbi:MAG: dipeptidase [Gemmatimonadota bacterium]|nr:dipeptidase [Gemmatimonadota bacterium]